MKLRRLFMLGTVPLLAVTVVLGTAGCTAWRIKHAVELARQSEPFEVSPTGASVTLLVVGDSTAVGTGASAPAQSVAGLIARDHPYLKVVNRARDGARFEDIARQLSGLAGQRFDAILVLGGGNDVIRMTPPAPLEQNITRVVALARAQAELVVLMPSGNVGSAPFFFPPWSWLMTQRSKALHSLVGEITGANQALYVNLYKEKSDDPFAQRPEELNSKDGLHPSDAGYLIWYAELNRQADFATRLAALRP